jgi:hypothetical protein
MDFWDASCRMRSALRRAEVAAVLIYAPMPYGSHLYQRTPDPAPTLIEPPILTQVSLPSMRTNPEP